MFNSINNFKINSIPKTPNYPNNFSKLHNANLFINRSVLHTIPPTFIYFWKEPLLFDNKLKIPYSYTNYKHIIKIKINKINILKITGIDFFNFDFFIYGSYKFYNIFYINFIFKKNQQKLFFNNVYFLNNIDLFKNVKN